jgi:hypothetical protein
VARGWCRAATKRSSGGWGSAVDLVGPAVWLSSGASDYVNCQVIFVDGDMTVVV